MNKKDKEYGMGKQFGGSINIINKEIYNILYKNGKEDLKYQEIYYFFFTDGNNTYPLE